MEGSVTSSESSLAVSDLVQMFEDAEEASYDARKDAERDRDYVDNKQWTSAEKAELAKRGQPATVINRIKGKIEFLVGMEIERRIDPKAFPRTPIHQDDADGASQALKYATDEERYDHKRTRAWRNMLVEGAAGFAVAVEQTSYGPEIRIRRLSWDRMFWDPHSAESDFTDAGYLGGVIWMDYADAIAAYPDGKEAIDTTIANQGELSDTYDDKPKWRLWADKARKRVRIVQIWVKRDGEWYFAEYTKGGILKAGPSPYKTDKGESDCELIFASGYVDRDNNRYGIVREMISPQDEVNKRRSKALHYVSTNQTTYEEGAIGDINEFRRQKARPDGVMKVAPGALENGRVITETRLDLAETHFKLQQESKNEIDLRGPNATMMGEKTQGSSAASGKAIIASQMGGMMEIGELLDNLRDLDLRVFRAVWYRIRQFWDAEKWVRVTDDERNVKWVAMNVPPEKMQALAQQQPQMMQRVAGYVPNVAELDCDIIIDDAPDSVTPQLEQWEALVDLAKSGVPIPPDVLIEAAPNLKNKDQLLERMKQPDPVADHMKQVQVAGAEAEVEKTQSETLKNKAQAQAALTPDPMPQQPIEQPEGPKPPSLSIAFKDIPPDAQSQALGQAGISASPGLLAAWQADQARQQAAMKAQQRSPQPA